MSSFLRCCGALVLAAGLAPAPARAEAPPAKPKPAVGAAAARPSPPLVQAKSPPFSNDGMYWPCSTCHATEKPNPVRRTLDVHGGDGEPAAVFDHDAEHRWCLDCHDLQNRDLLRLANGDTVPFTESYRLCGQCHGDKYRDWRAGVHGKRVGRWDGEKTYFLCVNCHNPHTPSFKGVQEVVVDGVTTVAPTLEYLKPEPRPRRPEEMRR